MLSGTIARQSAAQTVAQTISPYQSSPIPAGTNQTDINPTAAYQPVMNPSGVSPAQTAEMEAIRIRLAQQDAELAQLRLRLGQLQNQASPLPPVGPPSGTPSGTPPPGSIQPAGMMLPDGTTMDVIPVNNAGAMLNNLQDRMTSLEQRLDAQGKQAANPSQPYEVGSDLKMSASWRNGVQIQSANKDFRSHIGGVLQYDSAFFDNPPGLQAAPAVGGIGPQPDSLDFRRVRLRFDGTMYEVFDYFLQVDFANLVTPAGNPNSQSPATTSPAFDEMYINWGQIPVIGNFRAGNIKEPLGFEHMMSDAQLPFMERSYLQDFIFGPFNGGYSPGLEILNWREDERGTWAVGVFGADNDQFGFSLGNDYSVTTRETWCPYYDEPSDGRYLVHFGVAGSVRSADEDIIRLRTRGDVRSGPPGILNPIYVDTNFAGKINATSQDITAAEFACVLGSFSVVAEYAGTWIQDAAIGNVSHGTPFFQGGYVQCGYFLTGEHEIYDRHRGIFDRVIPLENAFFVRTPDGVCHGWGAWQVLARYNAIDLNDNDILGGTLNSFTLGVNWFWTPNARMQLNYDFTSRSAVKTVAAADINMVGLRFSYDF
jgi:phosphate-selective porin OprO/OprP